MTNAMIAAAAAAVAVLAIKLFVWVMLKTLGIQQQRSSSITHARQHTLSKMPAHHNTGTPTDDGVVCGSRVKQEENKRVCACVWVRFVSLSCCMRVV